MKVDKKLVLNGVSLLLMAGSAVVGFISKESEIKEAAEKAAEIVQSQSKEN